MVVDWIKRFSYFWDMPRLRVNRHERFAREIAALSPLATAYREAGYGGDPRWHAYNASRLANRPHVKARIDELREQFEQLSAIHVDYIRHQLLKIVEADPRELYERDPTDPTGKRSRLRYITELPGHLSRAIARLKIDENGAPTEVILASKVEASGTLLRSLPGGSIERRETIARLELLDPANLAKLPDDEVVALKRIAQRVLLTADDDDATKSG
jgi:hypothetical protein